MNDLEFTFRRRLYAAQMSQAFRAWDVDLKIKFREVSCLRKFRCYFNF